MSINKLIYNIRQVKRLLGGHMKLLKPPRQTILTGVKSIFLNPYHYTYVIHKEDNFIYLYDQMTMDTVGRTRIQFTQTFRMFAFTDNFNCFCTYVEGKYPLQSTIIVFSLQSDGNISHYRYAVTRNRAAESLSVFNISLLDRDKQRNIVCLGRNRIYYINLSGQIVKDIQIRKENKQVQLVNGFSVKQGRWILVQENAVYFASISWDQYKIEDSLPLNSKITSISIDTSVRHQFMAFLTEMHMVMIVSRVGDRWKICYKFKIPNLFIRRLCFFFPAVNTSTTNFNKDKVFLVIYGDKNYYHDEKHININDLDQENVQRFNIPKDCLDQQALYIYQYSMQELSGRKGGKIQPRDMFCIKNVGVIKYSIWANEHDQNCVRIFNQDKSIVSIDLICLLPGQYTGKEWVCLGYKFEPKTMNVLYEQTEDNFQKQKKEVRTITEEQLNDWSYSLFPKQTYIKRSIRRLNCIQF